MSLPLYERVRKDLERQIASGQFAIGDWLPSEAELRAHYGVSVTPIRQALNDLERMGLISRHQGRGSQVRSTQIATHHGMIGFSSELKRRGHEVVPRNLVVRMETAAAEVSQALRLEHGAKVLFIRRLFVVDGEPFAIFDHFLRPFITVEQVTAAGELQSLYKLMAEEGGAPIEAAETVSAALIEPEDAKLLGLDIPGAVLLRRRIGYGPERSPIEFTIYRIRPDRYSMEIEFLTGAH
jgi:GntR family transcriptional regulator